MLKMKKEITNYKPGKYEKELHINIHMNDEDEWVAEIYTNIHKYHNRCIKQGWKQLTETVHTDGTWIDGTYIAPARAINIGKAVKPKRVMSEEQKIAAAERMKKWQQTKNKS
jgi:hypothetical protein